MIEKNIKLTSINDVKKFVGVSSMQEFDIDVVSGRYVVDAKSILAILGLDTEKEFKITIDAEENRADVVNYLGCIKQFEV